MIIGDDEETYKFMDFEELKFQTQYDVPAFGHGDVRWLLDSVDEELDDEDGLF